MKNYNSRNIAKALISKLYTEGEMHKAMNPDSKASERYDEVLTIMEKGYDYKKREKRSKFDSESDVDNLFAAHDNGLSANRRSGLQRQDGQRLSDLYRERKNRQ